MSLSFLAPQFLWALLALPLVVLLHFLRTRRRSRIVSALFLWRQASEAASVHRRLSPTWLLLLQLLFVTLAALALARPLVSLEGPPDQVIVVDASASMAARDSDGVRIDKARGVARSLLSGRRRSALVRAGLDATLATPLTSDTGEVGSALQALVAADRSADLQRALGLAGSLAPDGAVHLISDSPAPAGSFTFHPVGGDAVNHGITAFETSLGQAYLAVGSNDPRPQEVTVRLLRSGEELGRSSVLVPAGGQANLTFPVTEGEGFLEARLEPPAGDALQLDDAAYAGRRSLDVTVEQENGPLLRALDALSGVDYRVGAPARGEADLTVLFGADPEELGAGNFLVFAERSEEPVYRNVRDWAQGDELLRFVDLREVVVGLSPDLPAQAPEGWEVLARAADLTPVLARRSGEGGTVVWAAFHPSQTDMVLRPAFPTFVANLVDSFRGQSSIALGSALPEGSTLDGTPVSSAEVPGIYQTPDGPVAASLLSPGETRLPAAQATVAGGEQDPEQAAGRTTRALWSILMVVAVVLLLVEWFGWSRGGVAWLRGA